MTKQKPLQRRLLEERISCLSVIPCFLVLEMVPNPATLNRKKKCENIVEVMIRIIRCPESAIPWEKIYQQCCAETKLKPPRINMLDKLKNTKAREIILWMLSSETHWKEEWVRIWKSSTNWVTTKDNLLCTDLPSLTPFLSYSYSCPLVF